jgi:hypothetical protein
LSNIAEDLLSDLQSHVLPITPFASINKGLLSHDNDLAKPPSPSYPLFPIFQKSPKSHLSHPIKDRGLYHPNMLINPHNRKNKEAAGTRG